MNATVCTIKSFLCHDIKHAMSYHIMEFYVTTCCMSQLSRHPYNEVLSPSKICTTYYNTTHTHCMYGKGAVHHKAIQ